ncbi:precorrin-6y C5,15-methyltransferase (decarboxylating) subunit CbiE [Roseivivax sp.]
MADRPWLTILGLGEDGPEGLPPASRAALEAADCVIGPARHLALLPDLAAERIEWPVPFAEGLPLILARRGRPTVALASGDPFWFGAGRVLAEALEPGEWRALPGPSTFSLAAARLGWGLERTTCLGLHAAPLTRLRPHLAPGARILALLRDGAAVDAVAELLCELGFGESSLTLCEALGGPRERVLHVRACDWTGGASHPVALGLEIAGPGAVMTCASGREDALFASDGQMTKRPVRALALSALAPRPGERLWDIGGGSGSIAIEWLLAHHTTQATSIEPRPARAANIRANAAALGVDRLLVVEGTAPEALAGLPAPDVVFIGGGLSRALLDALTEQAPGARLVAHAVTLESEALLADWQAKQGGELLRIELAEARPLGSRRGWAAAYPVVQYRGRL